MSLQFYDLDDMTSLPNEVIYYLSIYNIKARVKQSPSTTGLHLMVDCEHDLPICKKYSDGYYEARKERFPGKYLLWGEEGDEYFKIENYGVWKK